MVVVGTFGLFINLSPETICCCLQTCYVYGVLLTCLAYTIVPSFMATTANIIGIVIGKCSYLEIKFPEAICCCLQTCYVYDELLTLPCTYIPTFMATTANTRLINCLRLFVVVYKPVMFMVFC